MWIGILDEHFDNSSVTSTFSYDKWRVSRKIFDCIISSLFSILEKLDLRTKQRFFYKENGEEEEFHFCDPNIDLCPVKPRDFHIFFNIVDFYKDIFKCKFQNEYFRKWMENYCLLMIKYYNKNPLISGFLKLIECAFNVGDLFINPENTHFRMELSYFLENVLQKSHNFHGEIQQSCISLIFNYPVDFYKNSINDLVKVFEAAFNLGHSNIWIAKLTINTLIKLYNFYENTAIDMTYFCENVFPHLNSFLETKFEESNLLSKKRLKKEALKQIIDSDIYNLQKRIMEFLGKLNQDRVALVVIPYKNLTKWSSNQIVEIRLNLPDIAPTLYLDSLLPRMCHLAMKSTDNQTKISSCEFIHAYIIYLIGRRYISGHHWEQLCNTILFLGAVNDITIQEMFMPLLNQIMHYMSRRDNVNTDGVEVLIKCLMNGISNNSNNSMRDLSAICIREFVEWSIKQSSAQQLDSSPASIQSKF